MRRHSTTPPTAKPGSSGPALGSELWQESPLAKIAGWGMATAGSAGAGTLACTLAYPAHGHALPPGLYMVDSLFVVGSLALGGFATYLRYKIASKRAEADLEIARARAAAEKISAETDKARVDNHRSLIEKALGEPDKAINYIALSDADARWNAVDKNGVRLISRGESCSIARESKNWSSSLGLDPPCK